MKNKVFETVMRKKNNKINPCVVFVRRRKKKTMLKFFLNWKLPTFHQYNTG